MEEPEVVRKRRSRVLEYYEKKEAEKVEETPEEDDAGIFQEFADVGLDEFGTEPFK